MSNLPPAKKSLGQCFLVESRYAQEIVAALGIGEDDTIVEIGPGRGFLTEELLNSKASRVIAVEIDQRLLSVLQSKYGHDSRLELHHADFVEADFASLLPDGPVKVVGNLPYHLSAEIIYRLLKHARAARLDSNMPWIELAVLMTQKEVADRIVAKPGSRTYGKLSVFVQLEAYASPVLTVPAEAFRPQPKVDGGVIRLEFQKLPEAYPQDLQALERIVRYCFHQRRKMLKGPLSSLSGVHPHWQSAEIDFTRRPETLTLSEWVHLSDTVTDKQKRIG
jgi:16S rRNA (adenine1518-N6/adenine1519-N6)-dimethyltransferase